MVQSRIGARDVGPAFLELNVQMIERVLDPRLKVRKH